VCCVPQGLSLLAAQTHTPILFTITCVDCPRCTQSINLSNVQTSSLFAVPANTDIELLPHLIIIIIIIIIMLPIKP
jgi:archaellum biogenesis protein FlaJ (TadC family)